MQTADVAIVGAGPGGLAAALELADAGASVVVVDEQALPGGQIYRQPPASFDVRRNLRASAHDVGKDLLARFAEKSNVRWLNGTTACGVLHADADGVELLLAGTDGLSQLGSRKLLLAPGAYDLPVALPGWTLPGVMAAGAVQAFAKSQQLLPGSRFVLAGAHPLLFVVADQLLAAGADIAAVAFAQARPPVREALADLARLRGAAWRVGELAGPLLRLRRAGVPVLLSTLPVAVEGEVAVARVRLSAIDRTWRPVGESRSFDCDTFVLGFGFVPSSELARQAGCVSRWDEAAGGWIVPHDRWMRTSMSAIAVAGEITGIAGAEQAIEEGRLAALGILADLGRLSAREIGQRAAVVRRRLAARRCFSAVVRRRFALRSDALAELATADTVVCRCEDVTAGVLRDALAANPHVGTLDAAKLLTRVGMGPCQGRMCQHTVTQIMAACLRRAPADLGAYRARLPAKPISLAALAAAEEVSSPKAEAGVREAPT
jgi:D-hydroxyproline dehydrogenase subunit alpha